jgi:hypothetical protein
MKKSISAFAVLASAITANASTEWSCLPASADQDKVVNIVLCDATAWNVKNQKRFNLQIDSETGCMTSGTSTTYETLIEQSAAYKLVWDEAQGKEVPTELRECTDDEALSIMVEL